MYDPPRSPRLRSRSLQLCGLASVAALLCLRPRLCRIALIAGAVVGAAAPLVAVPATAWASPAVAIRPAPAAEHAEEQHPQQWQEQQREEEEPETAVCQQPDDA